MVSLIQLPEEVRSDEAKLKQVILQIHLYSLSPFLPLTHPILYRNIHNAPRSHIALYLLHLYSEHGANDILIRAVRHPVCSVAVVREIQKIWDRRKKPLAVLTCSELPRRLFRSSADGLDPLLDHLMTTYSPSPDSHKGYPLCRAVLTSNTKLIKYLLVHGADPAVNHYLPLRIATQKGSLDLVKLMVEPAPDTSAKRVKRVDRVAIGPEMVELAMKHGQEHIVRYFVHDKGVIPPLRSIMKMSQGKPTKRVPRGRA